MRLGFIVIIIVLFSSVAYAGDAETVGEATYTWVAVKSDPDVFSNARTALGKIDFKKSTIDGTINLTSIAEKFYNSYGGVLLWVSHGTHDSYGNGYIAVEQYSNMSDALDRMQILTGGYYSSGDLAVMQIEGTNGYWVCLTNQGINNHFTGNNAIALIAACYGGLTGTWGARVRVGYDGSVQSSTAQSEMTNLVDYLTGVDEFGQENYSHMTVSKAIQSGQSYIGEGNTALIPWILSYYPDSVIGESCNSITVKFGTKMSMITNPFTVTGECSVNRNEWVSDNEAIVEIDCDELTKINVKLEKDRIKSSNGISLKADWDKDYDYGVVVGSTWGEIKSWYSDGVTVSYNNSEYNDGVYEPRSLRYNRVAWEEFSSPCSGYNVLRSTDEDSTMHLVGVLSFGDTVFIDSSVVDGHSYRYRVVTVSGDSISYTDEMNYGPLMVSELPFYDIRGNIDEMILQDGDTVYVEYDVEPGCMIKDGNFLYIACKDKVKKIDVSDPYNPIEIGSRDISSFPYYNGKPIVRDIAIGYYDGYLFVLTETTLILINKDDPSLPIVSSFGSFPSGYYKCNALAIMGNIAYIATYKGIHAVSFQQPTDLEIWGNYTGYASSEGNAAIGLEAIDGYLYAELGNLRNCHFSEILKPRVYGESRNVYFDVMCSDHDDSLCLNYCEDLIGVNGMLDTPLKGTPKGYYTFGKANDSTFAVFDISDPLSPIMIKTVSAPFESANYGNIIDTKIRSYAFDGKYLYLTLYRYLGNPWSPVYVYDLLSSEQRPIYAIGDLNVGQKKGGVILSSGEYLYYFDKAKNHSDYHILRILRKSNGCSEDIQVSTFVEPISNAYEIGQNCKIYWSCTGCPIRVKIRLYEDDVQSTTIASLDLLGNPELKDNFIDWTVCGISSEPDSHLYRIGVYVENIEGNIDESYSNYFRIVQQLPYSKPEEIPMIYYSSENGERLEYPVFNLVGKEEESVIDGYWLFPENPLVKEGKVGFSIKGCRNKILKFNALDLMITSIDDTYNLDIANDGLVVKRRKNSVSPLFTTSTHDSIYYAKLEKVKNGHQSVSGRFIEVALEDSIYFEFSLPELIVCSNRSQYLIKYNVTLTDANKVQGQPPKAFSLLAPYPNPFNGLAVIKYQVAHNARVKLGIYDVCGRRLKKLIDSEKEPGVYHVTWDGKNDEGGTVASGVYFCRLTVDTGQSFARKIIVVR